MRNGPKCVPASKTPNLNSKFSQFSNKNENHFGSKLYLTKSTTALKNLDKWCRHSSIYAVNVGTHKKTAESKNTLNQGYLVVLKGRKIE